MRTVKTIGVPILLIKPGDKMYLYYQFLEQFNITDEATPIIILVFVLSILLSQILRLIIFIGYQAQYSSFRINAKDLKAKSDISSIKKGLMAKIVKDYAKSCDKGIANVSTISITKKHLLRMRFIYWTYDSIGRFISSIETQVLLIGVLLAVFSGFPMVFGVLSIALFAIIRILAATFDYKHAYDKLENEIAEYLEREIGQFYILDLNTGLHRLNKTMLDGAANQSAIMSDSIKNLGENLSGVLKLVVGDIQKNIEDTVNTINSYSDVLKKPLDEWRSAVEAATENQIKVNSSAELLKNATYDFREMTKSAEQSFKGYIDKLESEKEFISAQIHSLKSVSEAVTTGSELSASNKDALENALKYIEKNQAVLDESLGKYELALEQTTGKLGDALGSILNYHIENSYNNLNVRLTENIDTIIKSNADLSARLMILFEDMTEQMKGQLKTVINLKEQMDMRFEALNHNAPD